MYKKIILFFCLWRILLFVPLVAGLFLITYRPGFEYTNIWKFKEAYFPVSSNLLYPWANFDGVHYLRIAGEGYTNNYQFFPVYPFIIKFLSSFAGFGNPFGPQQFFSGLLISNIALLGALLVFYKLLRIDYSSKISFQTIVFLLLFPTSFFLAGVYSESLLLLFVFSSLYFARRKNFLAAGIFGMLSVTTRIVGIAIFPVLLWELYIQSKSERNKTVWLRVIFILLSPIGLILYSVFNKIQTGDYLYFIKAHGQLFNGRSVDSVILLPQTLFRYAKILLTLPPSLYEWWVALLEISSFVFAAILLFTAFKMKVKTSYLIFGVIAFLIPSLSGTFSGLPRYILIAFPIFIALGLTQNRLPKIIYLIIAPILLILLLTLFSKGYYVS